MVAYPHGQIRAATHYGVSADDIETTIAATRAALKETTTTESAESTQATNGTESSGGTRTPVTARRPD
jgi:hypothetical protein